MLRDARHWDTRVLGLGTLALLCAGFTQLSLVFEPLPPMEAVVEFVGERGPVPWSRTYALADGEAGLRLLRRFGCHEQLPLRHGERFVLSPNCESLHRERIKAGALLAIAQRLDPNELDPAGWMVLPGIGPVLAQRIVAMRERLGRFATLEQLELVKGIGPKRLAAIRPFLETPTPRD